MGHFSVFLCTGAKPFIIAHQGFHHSVGKGLKYLGYQGYIYAHSPVRGPQLSSKKTRKQYFSRLCQKVDFVGLFSQPVLCKKALNLRSWTWNQALRNVHSQKVVYGCPDATGDSVMEHFWVVATLDERTAVLALSEMECPGEEAGYPYVAIFNHP